jgi:hypothetical protein
LTMVWLLRDISYLQNSKTFKERRFTSNKMMIDADLQTETDFFPKGLSYFTNVVL